MEAGFNIHLMVFTDGRLEYLEQTIRAARQFLPMDMIRYKSIFNDDPSELGHKTLEKTYGDEFIVWSNIHRMGFCQNIATAWQTNNSAIDYIFHLEDDFVIQQEVDLHAMIRVLENHVSIAQMSLLRQPWSVEEKIAGGIIQLHRDEFFQEETLGHPWVRQARYFTTNPSIYPRRITEMVCSEMHPPGCEGKVSRYLVENGYQFGIWGRLDDRPRVIHIGEERKGTGY